MPDTSDDQRITAFGMLLEAHATLTRVIGEELEAAGSLPLTWFEVLIRLARSPAQRLRMTELAAQVSLSASGLTRMVDRIEAAGLIAREACPSDRRGSYAVLTDVGRAALDEVLPAHLASLERHLVAPLGPERLARLAADLECLRDRARDATV